MKMQNISLKDWDAVFRVHDGSEEATHGYSQGWYPTDWQRTAGCGPTAACNILLYLSRDGSETPSRGPITRSGSLEAMEEAWRHVTPGEHGIPTARMLSEGILQYAGAKGIDILAHLMDIPQDAALRPAFSEVLGFIATALRSDVPVAFLNLCNGEVCNLDRWHWVTILSLDYQEDGTFAVVCVLDEGRLKDIDLRLWYDTTDRGGGFAYFQKR